MNNPLQNLAVELHERVVRINQNLAELQAASIEVNKAIQISLNAQKDVTYIQRFIENLLQQARAELEPADAPLIEDRSGGTTYVDLDGAQVLTERYAPSMERLRAVPARPAALATAPAPSTEQPVRRAASTELSGLAQAADTAAASLRTALGRVDAARTAERDGPPVEGARRATNPMAAQLNDPLTGPRSVFVKFLAPDVLAGGRGFVKPDYAGLEQYAVDLLAQGAAQHTGWPSGFYRAESGARQFFVNLPECKVILPDVGSGTAAAVLSVNDGQSTWIPVTRLTPEIRKNIHDLLVSYFRRLEQPASAEQRQA